MELYIKCAEYSYLFSLFFNPLDILKLKIINLLFPLINFVSLVVVGFLH